MVRRNSFTDLEDKHLSIYIAQSCPENKNRSGNQLYERLVANTKRWPWAKTHTAQSWRERYVRRKEAFDKRINRWQAKHPLDPDAMDADPTNLATSQTTDSAKSPTTLPSRQPFTDLDDERLVQYLAIETPSGAGRKGHVVYNRLVSNPDRWPWSVQHTAQSWLERYRKRSDVFDARIRRYQDEHGIRKTGQVQRELWDKLPKIRSGDIQHSKQRLREGTAKVQPSSQKSKKRRVEEEEDEEEEAVQLDREKRKRRRLEKQRMAVQNEQKEEIGEAEAKDAEEEEKEEEKEKEEAKNVEEEGKGEEEEEPKEDMDHRMSSSPKRPSVGVPLPRQRSSPLASPKLDPEHPTHASSNVRNHTSAQDTTAAGELVVEEAEVEAREFEMPRSQSQEADEEVLDGLQKQTELELEADNETVDAAPHDHGTANMRYIPTQESYVVPSPETLRKLAVADRPTKISQEPTPPTSDAALSPRPERAKEVSEVAGQPRVALFERQFLTAQESPTRPLRAIHSDDEDEEEEDADFEADMPAAQSSVPRRQAGVRQPSARSEGSFDRGASRARGAQSYKVGSRVSGADLSDSDLELQTPWPPKRGKGKGKIAAAFSSTERNMESATATTPSHERADMLAETDFAKHPAKPYSPKRSISAARQSLSLQPPLDLPVTITSRLATPRNQNTPTRATVQPEAGPSNLTLTVPDTAERRHTLATPSMYKPLSRVQGVVRHSMPAYERRHSTGAESIASNVSFAGRIVTAEDHKIVFDFGMRNLLQQMATDNGFAYSTVESVWKLSGTLADTATTLETMRKQAEEGGNNMLEALRVEERVQERERSVLENQLASPVDLSTGGDVLRTFTALDRSVPDVVDEYWPPEDSKAGILLRQRMRDQERRNNVENQESDREDERGKNERPQDADETGDYEDKDADDESDSDDDSHLLQVERILKTVEKNYNK